MGEAKFGVSQFDLDMSYFVKGTPTKVTMALNNLKMGVGQIAIPGIRDTLTAFGYQDVDVSMELNGSWQERSSEIAVENVALSVAGLGKLSASGSLTGVTGQASKIQRQGFRRDLRWRNQELPSVVRQ